MMRSHKLALALLALALSAPAIAQHEHVDSGAGPKLAGPGQGSPQARGLYLLHNFEYGRATAAFREAQAADPANVMAYWGEAMTHNHPLWAEQDAAAAKAALARLAPSAQARRAKARTPREGLWLDAVEALYGDGSKVERDGAYHRRMATLFEADPADIDARTFYALSTLGMAHGGRDIALYMKAAALLEEVYPQYPDHPGVLHYLIHSYDDPAHAPLGVRAARRYAAVAPDAGHAQHMISHIFLALGDWPAVERTNVRADGVVAAQRAAEGKPASYCGHYSEWLVYSLLQQGKDATPLVERCRAQAVVEATGQADGVLGGGRSASRSWSDMASWVGVETGRWPQPIAWPAGHYQLAQFNLGYARLLAGRRDPPAVAAALATMRAARDRIVAALPREMPDEESVPRWLERAIAQGDALAVLAAGGRNRGLALLKAAAEAEAALPVEFGPPALAKPGIELYADELLAAGRRAEAAAAYRTALAAMPGRRLSQTGLAAATR